MEAIARQPEATAKIQTAMLIAAALIEGIGFAPTIDEIPTSALPNKITAMTATQNSGNELATASITAALMESGSLCFS